MPSRTLPRPFPLFLLLGVLLLPGLSACASLTDPGVARFEMEKNVQEELAQGHPLRAEQITKTLLATSGDSPFLLNQLAVIEDRMGNKTGSLSVLARAHRIFPDNTSLTLNLAVARMKEGQVYLARETLLPILGQTVWPNGFRTLMGRVDLATGNLPEAHLFLHEALSRHPDNPLILGNMGLLHDRLGLKKLARKDFRKALAHAKEGKLRNRLLVLLAKN